MNTLVWQVIPPVGKELGHSVKVGSMSHQPASLLRLRLVCAVPPHILEPPCLCCSVVVVLASWVGLWLGMGPYLQDVLSLPSHLPLNSLIGNRVLCAWEQEFVLHFAEGEATHPAR